ncbi:FAD-dependent oxidoreductase [uncultured Shewanella sp.]|uniref:NAD(P)/FAD-dependent oxidoreductase n=1 Tax=uncultured Shewanella sp. TaxID=173975 RepID=UPI0026172D8F|nr:FAD-dependent oxidoreductase [uncultured Shewanella sp.]
MYYDVAIIGAGVAGMAAASALARKGLTVALIESGQDNRINIGECLMADALPIMARLGFENEFIAAKYRSLQSYRVIWGALQPYERHLMTSPTGSGWIVDRRHFDELLLARCYDCNVDVYWKSKFQRIKQTMNGLWQFIFASVDMPDIEAHFVIDASGRARGLTKQLGIKSQQLDKMVASCCHIDTPDQSICGVANIVSDMNGWWYYAKFSHSRGSLCYFSDSDLGLPLSAEELLKQAQTTLSLTELLHQSKPVINTFRRCPAYSSALQQCIGHNWLAVGDAAMSFDPLSSYGMTSALSSAFYGSQAVLRYFKGDTAYLQVYQTLLQRNYLSYLVNREQEYRKVSRMNSVFWRRRQEAKAIHLKSAEAH